MTDKNDIDKLKKKAEKLDREVKILFYSTALFLILLCTDLIGR